MSKRQIKTKPAQRNQAQRDQAQRPAKPDTGYPILDWMIEQDILLTRKNYLELDHWGKPLKRVREGRNWEYELSLPPQFRMPFDD